ncbi:uncharacterized protein LOC123012934 isoform X1 [Tribolium madens]|uniref:uncharacterized protein LOC123012934 isoform X1 n=1 Tax=Tribolium madens TaxID=41895 RepID=UPI001CF7279A|nr:uncharacterized protein LOC123012934 isoform X1 [Tribolium madens]XP_044267112.1 uncharacterized protein LOC123012934 isoform X1 [Tribolium madens]
MAMVNMNNLLNGKDSRWLQLEVCREFQRNKCSRPDTECKFAHPPANVEVQNGRVTACYDSIKHFLVQIAIHSSGGTHLYEMEFCRKFPEGVACGRLRLSTRTMANDIILSKPKWQTFLCAVFFSGLGGLKSPQWWRYTRWCRSTTCRRQGKEWKSSTR